MKAFKIAIFNQKGGTAKTTSTINIGYNLSKKYKTLLVDMDSQSNLSQGIYSRETSHLEKNVYNVLNDSIKIQDCILETKYKNLYLLPSHLELSNIDMELSNTLARETILRKKINSIQNDYYFMLFDCSPTIGIGTLNVLSTCDYIIIPIDVGVFSFEGINRIIRLVKDVQESVNPNLQILGSVLTKANKRTTLTDICFNKMYEYFDEKSVFKTILTESVNIIRSQDESIPIEIFDSKLQISKQYAKLTNELLIKLREREMS
jgi:chromosome partitioning protein